LDFVAAQKIPFAIFQIAIFNPEWINQIITLDLNLL
jgi:hypothetical protein